MQFSSEQMLEAGITEEQVKRLLGNKNKTVFPNNVKSSQMPKESVALQVTTLHDLETYCEGSIIKLPDFAEGQPLIAKLRRPSMLAMAAHGNIPNSLLATAGQLFTGNNRQSVDANDPTMLKDMYDICRSMAEASLIEPTLQQIEGAGLELTDEQLMAIFNYTQAGIKALENFR